MPNVASGISAGIQQGAGLAASLSAQNRQARLDQERQQDREEERGLRAVGAARQARADERQSGLDQKALIGEREGRLRGSIQEAVRQGGFGSIDEAENFRKESAAIDDDREAANARILGQKYLAKSKQADDTLAKLQSGQVNVQDLSAEELGDAVAYKTGHPLNDFLDKGDKRGKIGAAVDHIDKAFRSQNLDGITSPVNTLLRPEIELGVGARRPNGDRIVDKKITDINLHPDDPNHALVGLAVTAEKPDGSTYVYHAPITDTRSADDTHAKNVSLKSAMDRINQYGELSQFLNDPSVRDVVAQKADEYQKAGGVDTFRTLRQGFIHHGGDPSKLDGATKQEQEYRFIYEANKKAGLSDAEAHNDALDRVAKNSAALQTSKDQSAQQRTETRAKATTDAANIRGQYGVSAAEVRAARGGGSGGASALQKDLDAIDKSTDLSDEEKATFRKARIDKAANRAPLIDSSTETKTDLVTGNKTSRTHREPQTGAKPAAVATKTAPAIAEGTTATNPKTGARVRFTNGKWEPIK